MGYIRYKDSNVVYHAQAKRTVQDNITSVRLWFFDEAVENTSGFLYYLDGECCNLLGDYSDCTTIYSHIDNVIIYNNGEAEKKPEEEEMEDPKTLEERIVVLEEKVEILEHNLESQVAVNEEQDEMLLSLLS